MQVWIEYLGHFMNYKEFDPMIVVSELFDKYLRGEMQDTWRGGNH